MGFDHLIVDLFIIRNGKLEITGNQFERLSDIGKLELEIAINFIKKRVDPYMELGVVSCTERKSIDTALYIGDAVEGTSVKHMYTYKEINPIKNYSELYSEIDSIIRGRQALITGDLEFVNNFPKYLMTKRFGKSNIPSIMKIIDHGRGVYINLKTGQWEEI